MSFIFPKLCQLAYTWPLVASSDSLHREGSISRILTPKEKIGGWPTLMRMAPLNICSRCGKVVEQREGGFVIDDKTKRFQLVCSSCFENLSIKQKEMKR